MRTAERGRKLTFLSNNIKCGNSLIDDPNFVGNKAFHWNKEFKEIFEKGGFDIIIGNPPYVSANNMSFIERKYFNESSKYKTISGKWDLFVLFIEKGLNLLKEKGFLSYIIPYGFLNQSYAKITREYIIYNFSLISILDLHKDKIFRTATVPSCIPIIRNVKPLDIKITINHLRNNNIFPSHKIPIEKYKSLKHFMFRTENLIEINTITNKLNKLINLHTSNDYFYISTGAEIHGKEKRDKNGKLTSGHSKFDVLFKNYSKGLKPYIEGSSIPKSKYGRYCYPKIDYYLDYKPNYMRAPKFPELFESEKILIRASSGLLGILATYDTRKLYTSHKTTIAILKSDLPKDHKDYKDPHLSTPDLKYFLGILNSKLINFYYKSTYGGFIDVYPNSLKSIPLPKTNTNIESEIINNVAIILKLNKIFEECKLSVYSKIYNNFSLNSLSRNIYEYYKYDFNSLLKELKKQNIHLSLNIQDEWEDYFNSSKIKISDLIYQIDTLKDHINVLIYNLYDISKEESKIVEKSIQS